MFNKVCDYKVANKLAKKIVQNRKDKAFESVEDFLTIINDLLKSKSSKQNAATLPFMALRMAVNNELENLTEALPKAFNLLDHLGRLAVISFHSGEDQIVKRFIRDMATTNRGRKLTKKPIGPGVDEITLNPRSRSAKLRVVEKIN